MSLLATVYQAAFGNGTTGNATPAKDEGQTDKGPGPGADASHALPADEVRVAGTPSLPSAATESAPMNAGPSILPGDEMKIAAAAREFQAQCARQGIQVSAAQAVGHVIGRQAATEPAKGQLALTANSDPASPGAITAFYGEVSATWQKDPALKKAYASYAAYQGSRQTEYCRTHAIGLEAMLGDTDPVTTLLNARAACGYAYSGQTVARIRAGYQVWTASPDLRREFLSFTAYADHLLRQ